MGRTKKVYRSLRGNNYLIARQKTQGEQTITLPPISFFDGLYSTTNPEEVAFIESLSDFGRGIKPYNPGAPPPAGNAGKKKAAAVEEKTIIVDSVASLNEAIEFLTGKGVPHSEIKTKKDIARIGNQMGISFPNLK